VAYDAAGPTRHATLSQQQKEKSRHASHPPADRATALELALSFL